MIELDFREAAKKVREGREEGGRRQRRGREEKIRTFYIKKTLKS